MYAKNIDNLHEYKIAMSQEIVDRYNKKDEYFQERGPYQEVGLFMSALKHGGSNYPIECPDGEMVYPPNNQPWRWNEETFQNGKKEGRIVFKKSNNTPLLNFANGERGHWNIYTKVYLKEREISGMHPKNFSAEYQNTLASNELNKLGIPFDFAKPTQLIQFLIMLQTHKNDLVLDFFSGSATTAHAVMQLNAEDGGNRKFIMVQLPEVGDEKSEAYKAGYKNICEIGKERIRRAGLMISSELAGKDFVRRENVIKEALSNTNNIIKTIDNMRLNKTGENRDYKCPVDTGFRVLKLDSSCMKDVYYSPNEISQNLLDKLEDNIKEDRTPEDLLFQVMLDMGVMLSSEIKTLDIKGKKVFNVNDGNLVCCFDKNINDEVVTAIARLQPLYAVFRDSSMSSDSVSVNFDQIFETYSPTTKRKIL